MQYGIDFFFCKFLRTLTNFLQRGHLTWPVAERARDRPVWRTGWWRTLDRLWACPREPVPRPRQQESTYGSRRVEWSRSSGTVSASARRTGRKVAAEALAPPASLPTKRYYNGPDVFINFKLMTINVIIIIIIVGVRAWGVYLIKVCV